MWTLAAEYILSDEFSQPGEFMATDRSSYSQHLCCSYPRYNVQYSPVSINETDVLREMDDILNH
jgi:hypothetical protein